MAYDKHTWQTQEPITAARMNNIEEGIANTTSKADANEIKIGYTSNEITAGGSIKERLNTLSSTVTTLNGQIDASFRSDLQAVKTQVNEARGNLSLAQTLQNIRDSIEPVDQRATTALIDVNGAHRNTGDTLKSRFEAIESFNVNQQTAISNLIKDITDAAQGQDSLDINLTNIKNSITQINTELKAGDDTTSLQVKLKGLSDRITTEKGRITTANTEIDNIKTTLGYETSSNPAQTIRDIIEANASDAQTQSTNAEIRAKAYADTKISENNTTLDTRFTSIESNISTIANELSMVDGNTIKDTNTRVDTIESTINNSTTGLAATKAIADEALTKANNAATSQTVSGINNRLTTVETDLNAQTVGLKARVSALENAPTASTTKVINNVTYNSDGIPTNIGETPSSDIDYLLKNEDKYYYWKYINNKWELISGAVDNTSGTSSGLIVDQLPSAAEADENTDYFVYNEETNAYLHYRFMTIDNVKQAILIGANLSNIKQYNIEKIIDGDKTYLRLYEFNYGDGNTINLDNTKVFPWVSETSYEVDNLVLYQGYFYKCITANSDTNWNASKWERISDIRAVTTIELPQGGGGGASSGAVTRFIRLAPTSVATIQNNDPIYIHFFYSCVDPNVGSFEGHYTLTDKNGVQLLSDDINSGSGTDIITAWPQDREEGQIYNDGYGSIDVAPYCVLGKNTFNLTITTGTNETFTRTWTVDIKQLNIESTAPSMAMAEIKETINLSYIPYGAMEKTLIVKIDGVQVKTESLGAGVTGTEQICTIPAQSVAGAHTIELRLSAFINGETKTSDPIIRDYIWYDPEDNNTIIISSPYRNKQIETIQYSEIMIPYTIYKANTNNFTVEYYYDYNSEGENIPFDTITLINTNSDILRYIPTQASLEDSQQSTANNKVYIPNHLTIKVEDTILTFDFIATPMQIDIAPVGGEVIDFNPATLNNNSINRLPSYLSVSDNFNWSFNWEGENQDSGGGYRTDEDGKCFVIKAGTYAEIDYQMFKQHNVDAGDGTTTTTSNVFDTGAEIKLIFKVTNVRDASTTWFTNMGNFVNTQDENAKKVGIQLKAHEGWLKTDKASDIADTDVELPAGYVAWNKTSSYAIGDVVVYKAIIYQCIKAIEAPAQGQENSWNKKAWLSLGQLETEISATNSYLYFPYSEDDKIELDININKHGNNQNFIMSYEDGVPSKAYPYNYSAGGDILYHALNNESKIHIGSPDCDVHIYRLRIYNKSLTTNEILKNFIADGETIDECITRYDRNSIYYSPELNNGEGGYTPYKTGAATLDPYRLAERIPDVKVLMLDTPRFTTGKKDFVKGSTLRCIQASGGKVYPANLEKDNWYFFNGYHAGQGTTSDNYGQSARNVDFLFECDTEGHAPTKIGNLAATDFPDPNYVSAVAIGSNASIYDEREKTWAVAPGVTPDRCINWMDDSCKISLTHIRDGQAVSEDTSIPNNYFNLKVNVASSENVNNALFQKRYNDFLPYTSPAKNRDARIKNDMEFVPAVLFIRERDSDISTHKEFKDTNWHFYALGNLGDSKKTDYTRAYDPTDINEFTIEISDNNTANSQFQSGVFYSDPSDKTTATVETQAMADDPNIDQDPMKYIYPITSEQWNAKDSSGQYINYRHKTLSTDPFDGDHSFEFRYACRGAFRDGDIINPFNEEDPEYAAIVAQGETNRAVWEAFYEWIVTSTEQQFRDEAALWFVPSAVEFFYAFTHYYTMMDNRAKNTFWHFAKTGTRRAIPIGRAVPALFHIYEESDGNGGYQPASGTFDNTKQYYTQYAFDLWVYDTDTACGIDNNGELSFPYGKEDRDYRVAGQAASGWAFNGSGSIFWRRLSDPNSEGGFANEISTLMRQEDDNCFATAQHLINQFDEFQNCFPEEIWRLDIERKYIRTFTGASIDNSIQDNKQNIRFLRAMMQGRKKYQRRQWVRNQAVYFGSKYGLSNVRTAEHTIEFNIYTPSSDGVAELAVPVDQSQLVIKPYQDMYIDIAVGNSTTNLKTQEFKRAKAGERVVVDCRSGGSAQETRVYIFGGEHIAALENLAPMYTYSGSFGQGKHLKVLDLGSDNPNYNNPRFTSISINENMPLLERFSVKNCNRLAQSIDLHLSNNLREFEAEGSLITGVSLPNYSNIEVLHLPTTVTSLALNAAHALDDFYIKNKSTGLEDYSNLITLNINDSDYSENIDWIDVASKTLDKKINWLYLQNLVTASINNISDLDKFKNKKEKLEINYGDDGQLIKHIVLSGLLKVTGNWSTVEKQQYETIWPDLTLDVSSGTYKVKHTVTYKYDDYYDSEGNLISGQIIKQMYIDDGDPIIDIWQYTDSNNNIVHILDKIPSRASTVRNNYSFGLREFQNYIELSGWKMEGASQPISSLDSVPLVKDNLVIETYFYSTPRTYYVNWYLKSGTDKIASLVKTSGNPIEYGGGYELEAPTIQEIHNKGLETAEVKFDGNTVTYSIFDGWEKLPTNITPSATDESYDIYAKWVTNTTTLADLFADTTNLSPEQLLVLSAMSSTQKNNYINNSISIGSKVTYTLGQDSIKEGTTLVGPGASDSILRLDFQTVNPRATTIAPLAENNEAFTLMIDYCFNTDKTYPAGSIAASLVSCYEQNTSEQNSSEQNSSVTTVSGFGLYYNLNGNLGTIGPRVGFGDMFRTQGQSIAIGNSSNANARNVIVLRHPKNSSTLYIYSGLGLGLNGGNINSDVGVAQLTWNNTIASAVINFGQLTNNTSDEYTNIKRTVANGAGTIYQAKYWNEDLGIGECKRLAAWPHENITYKFSYLGTNATEGTRAGINTPNPSINLTSITNSSHGDLSISTTSSTSIVGWGSSEIRTFYNNRIFKGLPTKLQAILCKSSVAYQNANLSTGVTGNVYNLDTVGSSSRDYVYAPSIVNIQSNNNYTNEESIIEKRPYSWLSSNSDVEIYKYSVTENNNWQQLNGNAQYKNLRFPYIAINWSQSNPLRIFDVTEASISNFYNEINKIDGYIRVGDVCLAQDGYAYIYVNIELITQDGAQTMLNDGLFATPNGNGGWVKAKGSCLRSVAGIGGYRVRFGYITPMGITDMSVTSNGSVSLGINYELAI